MGASYSSITWAILRVVTGFTLHAQRSHQDLGEGIAGDRAHLGGMLVPGA